SSKKICEYMYLFCPWHYLMHMLSAVKQLSRILQQDLQRMQLFLLRIMPAIIALHNFYSNKVAKLFQVKIYAQLKIFILAISLLRWYCQFFRASLITELLICAVLFLV